MALVCITWRAQTGPLWNTIRVMGGAYGAMCSFGRASGTMSFLSSRDPNLEQVAAPPPPKR